MKKDLIQTVYNTIERLDMIEERDKVLIAVSGGPDSIFLFHALHTLKDRLDIKISIANLDHGIRGKASRIDSEFAKHISKSFNIGFIHKKLDLRNYKNNKLSQEETARKLRYSFLIRSAKKLGFKVVATAHTLDDQAETILMRVIKGTALRGIIGIPAVRYQDRIKIIRPLIEITKDDIQTFLKQHSIPYRIDHTNLQDVYFRNKIRNRVLPYLSKYNPRIKYALTNLAESLYEDFEFIEEERHRRRLPFYTKGNRLALKLKDIIIQPKALRKEILRDILSKTGANIKKLSYRHWKDVDNFMRLKESGKSIDLPGGMRIKKTRDSLVFFKLGKTSA